MIKINSRTKLSMLVCAALTLLVLSAQVFGQSTNVALSGTVQDTSEGYLPGVTVTATNAATGVETVTLSNDSGVFNFPSLQPGIYKVSAELDGFQTNTKTDLDLTGIQQSRLNFELEVAGLSEEIEVVTTAQDLLTESSSSTGTVLRSEDVIELPLTTNDVMELVNIMGGVTPIDGSDIFNRQTQDFAGVNANGVHVQQDGITLNDVRYNTGIASQSRINTEMVAEFKLVLSPVDAEMGRGVGQVQILTKSGANAFHGSGVWNITNTALDANSWINNRNGTVPNWRNLNTYTLTASGPIKKNKTFFFVSWDHSLPATRSSAVPGALTPCARKGIYRYFQDWMGWNYDQNVTNTSNARRRAAVDVNGFPLDQSLADAAGYSFVGLDDAQGIYEEGGAAPPNGLNIGDPINGTHYVMPDMGDLQFVSVFGPLTDAARAQVMADPLNCSQYDPYDGYDMSDPISPTSMAALGISRYYEDFDPEGGSYINRILDTTAIRNFSDYMPLPNDFRTNGDGLNYATHRWTRSQHGSDTIYGVGEENARKNLSAKIDHNFNDRHRMSANVTYERDRNPSASLIWPNGFAGTAERDPRRFSISLTSSLKPTILNEFRFGLNRNVAHALNALDATATKDEIGALMRSMIDTTQFENFPKGEPLVFMPLGFSTNYDFANTFSPTQSHFIGGRIQGGWGAHSFLPSWGGFDHRWQLTDTLTWTKGRHSLKFGGDVRLIRSHQESDGDFSFFLSRLSMPTTRGGFTYDSRPTDLTEPENQEVLPGLIGSEFFFGALNQWNLSGGSLRGLQDLRDYMAGSLAWVWQWFFINDPAQKSWNNIDEGEITRILDIRYKEFSLFAKDDWKVNNSLTLNLGLRYEYYGVPWLDNGMTLGLQGGSTALFGMSGRDFNGWMPSQPVDLSLQDESYLTAQEFIGPGSIQPDISAFNKDLNNFGPAVGFAWQIPWFGKGKTTLRGGYQLSYSQIANASAGGIASTGGSGGFSNVLAGSTGTNVDYYYYGDANNPYLRVADLDSYLPTIQYLQEPGREILPLSTLYVENRSGTLAAYDYNIKNPYTQSLNLSVTRNIGSKVTLSVRYIGTLGRKGIGSLNLNESNWISNGLIDDFTAARAGGTTDRLDRLFQGVQFDNANLLGDKNRIAVGAPGGPTGGDIARVIWTNQLSEGDFNAIADDLNTYNYTWQEGGLSCPFPNFPNWCFQQPGLNEDLPQPATNEVGTLLRHANTLYPGEFPENFIVANPQLGTATWYTNLNHNNYHSMQVQFSLRPTNGFNMQATYTWSKNLGNSSYTNPNDRTNPFDYTYTGNSRAHQFNMYGTWTLPFGANGFFFRDVSNPVARRIMEGWNISWITRLNSGGWSSLSADATHLYGNSVPSVVRPDLFDGKSGHVVWKAGEYSGNYFSQYDFVEGPDLQCYDESIVNATWEYNEDLQRDVLVNNSSLRDECINNMSALYVPVYETVTELQYVSGTSGPVEEVTYERLVYSEDNVVFKHPMPGEYGSYGRNKILGIGSWNMDMAMWKDIELTEGKTIGFRVDAGNIFNHPSPGNPSLSISQGGNVIGYIGSKTGQRRFQGKVTIRF